MNASIDSLYREHGDAVLRRARRFLRSEDDARDVVQDVFLDVCRRPDQFEARSSITTYLFSAATHACLNRIRNARTRARLLAVQGEGLERLVPARGESRALAGELLAGLSEEDAALAVYLYCDELTHDEVAEMLGCSRRHVGDRAARLRAKILARVEPTARPTAAIAAALACAAALALIVAWPRDARVPEVRTKGGSILGVFVSHGGQVRRGASGEAVAPGDRLEIFTTTTEPRWFAAIAVDGVSGAREVWAEAREIQPGSEHALPNSIELDGATGETTLHGVFCDAPFEAAAIDLLALPAGCTVDRLTLVTR